MKRMRDMMNTVNALTGKTGRQLKAMEQISEWADTVQTFLTRYDLYGSSDLKTLLQKSGDAKFDLIGITYNGRPMLETAKVFKKTELPGMVEGVVNEADAIRRYLIDPTLQEKHLTQSVLKLRVEYERLMAEINHIMDGE